MYHYSILYGLSTSLGMTFSSSLTSPKHCHVGKDSCPGVDSSATRFGPSKAPRQPWQCSSIKSPYITKELTGRSQPSNASSSMCLTESGMLKFAKELQFAKAQSPMWVTESGMVKLTKELQDEKAKSPMWVTESGMVKFTKELQP